MDILSIHPSQLYISQQKLQKIQDSLNPSNPTLTEAIPIKKLDDKTIFVDGHTRAVALYLLGKKTMSVYWEYEDLDWEMYQICVQWCIDEGVPTIKELSNRIIDQKEYEQLWYRRCDQLHESFKYKRFH